MSAAPVKEAAADISALTSLLRTLDDAVQRRVLFFFHCVEIVPSVKLQKP